jgi:hypothetical protein
LFYVGYLRPWKELPMYLRGRGLTPKALMKLAPKGNTYRAGLSLSLCTFENYSIKVIQANA